MFNILKCTIMNMRLEIKCEVEGTPFYDFGSFFSDVGCLVIHLRKTLEFFVNENRQVESKATYFKIFVCGKQEFYGCFSFDGSLKRRRYSFMLGSTFYTFSHRYDLINKILNTLMQRSLSTINFFSQYEK